MPTAARQVYDDQIRFADGQEIKARVLVEKGDRQLSRADNLLLIKRVTQDMYAEETFEVKLEVMAKLRSLKEERERKREDEGEDDDDELGSLERRPQDYQRYTRV